MAIAYSYIRFSSKAQADGDSLRRQLKRTKEWCRKNKIELSNKNFQDLGISAFKEKTRPSLDDLFTAIQTGSIIVGDYIILENLDRLSRQGIDHTQEMLRKILRSGVNVVDLTNSLELNKNSLNDLPSVIRVAIAADLAYQESKKKSERVLAAKAAQRMLVREGKVINKRLPFWIKKSDKYELNDKAEIVREIISNRACGVGYHKIAMNLNGVYNAPKAKHWSDTTIREIVKSRALYGSMVDKDGEVENVFPPLISFTEWQAIQSKTINCAGGHNKHNHLSRLVRCECGAAMSKKIQKSKTKTKTHVYNTWICTASLVSACDRKRVIRDLDIDVFKGLNHLKINKTQLSDDLDRINRQIEKKDKRIKKLESELLKDDAPIASLAKAITKTTNELSELRVERDSLDVASDSNLLINLQNDAIQFNAELRKVVKTVEVIPVHNNMWRIKIHQHNGHIVRITKFRKSQRSKWTWLIGKTEEIQNIENNNLSDYDGLPDVDWQETNEPTKGQVHILNEVNTDWAETDEPH